MRDLKQKFFFHQGDSLTLKTKVQKGKAWVDEAGLHIERRGGPLTVISRSDIISAELFRLHGTCTVIRVEHERGRLFLAVIRFLIGGQLMLVNYHGTVALQKKLASLTGHSE
jgi:hypothetical protein